MYIIDHSLFPHKIFLSGGILEQFVSFCLAQHRERRCQVETPGNQFCLRSPPLPACDAQQLLLSLSLQCFVFSLISDQAWEDDEVPHTHTSAPPLSGPLHHSPW